MPPGNEIYRDDKVSVFEVAGAGSGSQKAGNDSQKVATEQQVITEIQASPQGSLEERLYSENLCLISKLFIDHKNVTNDCTPFIFYVLVQHGPGRQTVAGYFSKEYGAKCENNLSCILILPHCQRKGYGKFLIEFSYELSKREGKKGTPERPLSDLGFRGYVSYWAIEVISYLLEHAKKKLSLHAISDATYIDHRDVLYVLENFGILRKA